MAQLSIRMKIEANNKTKKYIATTEDNFKELAENVAKELGTDALKGKSENSPIKTEGYTVSYYLDIIGNERTNGNGYITIWYTDNSLRSTINREEAISRFNLIDFANNNTVNQTTLVAIIHVENYKSELLQEGLTSLLDANADIKLSKFELTTLNEKLGIEHIEEIVDTNKDTPEKIAEMLEWITEKNDKGQANPIIIANSGNNKFGVNTLKTVMNNSQGNQSIASVTSIVRVSATEKPTVKTTRVTYENKDVYMWYDDDNRLCWWSAEENAVPKFTGDCRQVFKDFKALSDISGLENWDTSQMSGTFEMFNNCEKLIDLTPLKKWDFSNVTDISHAFKNCKSITTLDGIQNWNVSNVKSMQSLFTSCSALTDISALDGWKDKTSNVTNMAGMFQGDIMLNNLTGLSNWKTLNVTTIKQMFQQCKALEDIGPLSGWNVEKIEDMEKLFFESPKINSLDALESWRTPRLKVLTDAFKGVQKIKNVDGLKYWDVSNVTSLYRTFSGCNILENVNGLNSWNTSNISDLAQTFSNCPKLSNIDGLSGWNVSNVTTMDSTFNDCKAINNLNALSSWTTTSLTNLTNTFKTNSTLTDASGLDNWNVSKVTTFSNMFQNCGKLTRFPTWWN